MRLQVLEIKRYSEKFNHQCCSQLPGRYFHVQKTNKSSDYSCRPRLSTSVKVHDVSSHHVETSQYSRRNQTITDVLTGGSRAHTTFGHAEQPRVATGEKPNHRQNISTLSNWIKLRRARKITQIGPVPECSWEYHLDDDWSGKITHIPPTNAV